MKFRRDISSKRLFCKGVPVSSKRCSACREREKGTSSAALCNTSGYTVKDRKAKNSDDRYEDATEIGGIKYITKCHRTNVNSHEVTVTQRVHVLQHVTFIKHSILQTQLAEKAAVVIVSYGQVIPIKQVKRKQRRIKQKESFTLCSGVTDEFLEELTVCKEHLNCNNL